MGLKTDLHTTSVERAIAILEFLDGTRRGWNISELSRKLRIPKSTAHVLVATLRRLGYLMREPGTLNYFLSLKAHVLGSGLIQSMGLPNLALPIMESLAGCTGTCVHLAVLEKDQAVYIQKFHDPDAVPFDTYLGKRTNLHCTAVGKVLLAFAPTSVQWRILARRSFARYTVKTLTSATALKNELVKVRTSAYALDDEEEELNVRCIAVPVFNREGELKAALGLTGTTAQIHHENLSFLATRLRQSAARIIPRVPAKAAHRNNIEQVAS